MATAATEKVVTHERASEMMTLHSVDITRTFQRLVRDNFLESHNPGRAAVYCLPGAAIPEPEEVFGVSSEYLNGSSEHSEGNSEHSDFSSEHYIDSKEATAGRRNPDGLLISDQLDAPVIDNLLVLAPKYWHILESLAVEPLGKAESRVKI